MSLPKINKTDAKWLAEEYSPKRGYRIDNSTFQMHLRAYNILRATDKKVDCMSCEGKAIATMAKSIYEQHEEEIKKLASARQKKQTNSKK